MALIAYPVNNRYSFSLILSPTFATMIVKSVVENKNIDHDSVMGKIPFVILSTKTA